MSLITVNRCIQRSHFVEELVEDWQLHQPEQVHQGEIEELAIECVWLSELVDEGWKNLRRKLFDPAFRSKFQELDRTFNIFRPAVARASAVFDRLAQWLPENPAGKFHAAHERIKATAALMDAQWPRIDEKLQEAARSDYLAGNYDTIEDLLHEAQGGCP